MSWKTRRNQKNQSSPAFFCGKDDTISPVELEENVCCFFWFMAPTYASKKKLKKKLVKAGYTYYSANVKRHLWKNSPRKVSPKKCCRCCRRLFSRYHPTAKVSAPSPPHWSSGLRVIPPIDHAEVRSHRIKPYEEHGRYGIELGKLRHLRWESTGCHFPQKK